MIHDDEQLELNNIHCRLIECILYIENEPIPLKRLKKLSNLPEEDIISALSELKNHYAESGHGLELMELASGYQFLPHRDLNEILYPIYGRKIDKRLSKAALETLSIIAYSQPITRREIENLRGVSSDSIIRILLERDYIQVVGTKDVIGHPRLLGTTKKFLFDFNISSISDLPKLHELDVKRFANEK